MGKSHGKQAAFLICGILLVRLTTLPSAAAGEASLRVRVERLIQAFPARDALERDRLAAELTDMGSKGIQMVCSRLAPPGMGPDAGARYALGALAVHVRRKGAENERIMTARAFHKALKLTPHKEVRGFLIGQLQLIGGHESVKPLREYLSDSRLCDPAARALLAIGTPDAEEALRKALKKAERERLVTLVRALGEIRSRKSVKKLLPYIDSENDELRSVARFALANIGAPEAETALERVAVNSPEGERSRAVRMYLLYLRRRTEEGQGEECLSKLRALLTNYEPAVDSPVSGQALELILDIRGEEGLEELISALESPNPELRGQALLLADRIPGVAASARWAEKLRALASPEIKSELIAMLGRRGDPSVLPVLIMQLNSDDPRVRKAAIPAAAGLGGESVLNELLALLESADEQEIGLIKQACLGFTSERVVSEANRLLNVSAPPVQVALIEILAARRARRYSDKVFALVNSDVSEVRSAALKALPGLVGAEDLPRLIDLLRVPGDTRNIPLLQDALAAAAGRMPDPEDRAGLILAELERVDISRRGDFIRPLARIGGERALAAVLAAARGEDRALQTIAVHTLVQWEDPAAMDALLDLAGETSRSKHRYLAAQGYLRLLYLRDKNPDDLFEGISRLSDLLETVEEKNLLLDGLAGIRSLEAVREAALYLDEVELRPRAVRTIKQIVLPDMGTPGLLGREVLVLLEKIQGEIDDEYELERVRRHIALLKEEEEFQSLFNGRDFTGWVGGTDGYTVENGMIVVRMQGETGNIYTEREFDDFVLRFEFRLTPGANNGLGIRAPLEGDAAYNGMEIQILDNSAPKHADLEPYQVHGSVYGVAPARRGFQRPVGEWNSQEVIASGSRIIVRLNGVTIVDTDIEKARKEGAMDGRPHPGLERVSGHIGFLGHGSRVEFRNIRIKELK